MSSSLFFLEVVEKLFDFFWKPYSLFSKFCVNCLLMFYFVYCNDCALRDVNGDCYVTFKCLNCVSDLRRLEKTLNFFICIHVIDLVLKYCSDINEGNWLQLLFYIIVLVVIVSSVIGMFFFSCVSGFRLKLSVITFWRKRMQLDSKSDLTTNGLILWFVVGTWLLSIT